MFDVAKRLRGRSPDEVMRKLWGKLLRTATIAGETISARISRREVTDEELRRSLTGTPSLPEILSAIRQDRPGPAAPADGRERVVAMINESFPEHRRDVINRAEAVCSHVFDLLGSGPTNLDDFMGRQGGRRRRGVLPWHFDFKTGYKWNPQTYHKRIKAAHGRADIKVPWELSRFQHVAVLGQAYWLTGHEGYAQEFVRQVEDWISCNPRFFGVNWACTMDVSIRAANWVLALHFFRQSPSVTDGFLIRFMKSLLVHGRHIMANLENHSRANNHYLANLAGLILLGLSLPEFKESSAWLEYGRRELLREMDRQVLEDGASFEGSTCYHGLATELFLYPAILCRRGGIDLPEPFLDRLEKMLDFMAHVLKPNGTMPQIGDNDSGRVFVLGRRDPLDMTWLLTTASLWFHSSQYIIQEFGFPPEALWLLGPEACEGWQALPGRTVTSLKSRAFPLGGYYVMRHDKDYMLITCGSVSESDQGGHVHDDKLSVELSIGGMDVIVDPGTYQYTALPLWRNTFRSRFCHNTLHVGVALNSEPSASLAVFGDLNQEQAACDIWTTSDEEDRFNGHWIHGGTPSLSHRRDIHYCKATRTWRFAESVAIQDSVVPNAVPSCSWRLTLAPPVSVNAGPRGVRLRCAQRPTVLSLMVGDGLSWARQAAWYSPEYGRKVETQALQLTYEGGTGDSIQVRYELTAHEGE